jgi:hypothetical protein
VLRGEKVAIQESKLRMGLPYKLADVRSAASCVCDSRAAFSQCACVLACGFWLPWDLGNAVFCSAGLTHPCRMCRACTMAELIVLAGGVVCRYSDHICW